MEMEKVEGRSCRTCIYGTHQPYERVTLAVSVTDTGASLHRVRYPTMVSVRSDYCCGEWADQILHSNGDVAMKGVFTG